MLYSLDSRCQQIIKHLVYASGYQEVQDVCNEFSISRRSFYYDLNKINDWLKAHDINEIIVERKKGIFIMHNDKDKIISLMDDANSGFYVFSPTERLKVIICSILNRSKPLFIEDFMELTQVSRNTIINDMKAVIKALEEYNLELIYENKTGYYIKGDVIKKRSVFFLMFLEISELYHKNIISFSNGQDVEEIENRLKMIEKELHTNYVSGILFSLAAFFSNISYRKEELVFSIKDRMEIAQTQEYKLVSKMFPKYTEGERYYLSLHLLGSRLQTVPISLMNESDREANHLAENLVKEFSRIACIEFDNVQEIVKALAAHLKTSLYRYRYGIQLGNVMLDDIKNEYRELFELTKTACLYLEQQIGVPIPDSEVAYITLHFGGYMNGGKTKELDILIICPNGISTGNMLRGEVRTLVPHANKIDVISLSQYPTKEAYDVIISTIPIQGVKNLAVVHPILTDSDRVTIMQRCMKNEKIRNLELEKVIRIASKYIEKDKLQDFIHDLDGYISFQKIQTIEKKYDATHGILHYLNKETMHIFKENYSWQQAISMAAKPLLESRKIEQRYIDAIIQRTLELGPCMFITDEVVLAHAKIEEGSLDLGFSLAKFDQPIHFDNQREASIILVLSARDQTSHIKILNDIMEIFHNNINVQTLKKATNTMQIYQCIDTMLRQQMPFI